MNVLIEHIRTLLDTRRLSSTGVPGASLMAFALSALIALGAPLAAWADDAEHVAVADTVGLQVDFGLEGFVRYNAGAQRLVDGVDLGYRFPVADGSTVVVMNTPATVWVHVDEQAAEEVGFVADDPDDVDALVRLIEQLDEDRARGGQLLSQASGSWKVTTADEVVEGSYRYIFRAQAGDDGVYTSVQPAEVPAGSTPSQAAEASGLELGDGVLWVDDARLVAASDIAAVDSSSWQDEAASFFADLDLRPFWVSIKTSGVALAVSFALGLFAAWKTMGTSGRLKGLLDSLFTIPMVLPPTVCGFLLLLLFGQSTDVGRWLIDHGVALVFTWPAAVISAVVVSFPLMYRTALGAFEALDEQMLDAARTLGWSERRIFTGIMLPLAWPSIAAGTVLAFARAMGEFGCTLFFAGNYAGVTQTIPIAIYFEWMSGNTDTALFWVIVVILFCFFVILLINLYTARSQRYRGRALRRTARSRDGAAPRMVDGLEAHGGDAIRIDRDALAMLLGADGRASVGGEKGRG